MDWHGSPWSTLNLFFLSFWALLQATGKIGRASSEHQLFLVTTGEPMETKKTATSRGLEFAWLENHGKLGKAVVWRKYLGKKLLTGPVHHNSQTKLNWSRDGEKIREIAVRGMIWKQHKVKNMKIENRVQRTLEQLVLEVKPNVRGAIWYNEERGRSTVYVLALYLQTMGSLWSSSRYLGDQSE